MVRLRGIDVGLVSHLSSHRLPEITTSNTFNHSNTSTSCRVPVLPGSQVWLEYSVDGPHAPSAAYLFKLFIGGEAIVAWDCTAKHRYQGKVQYALEIEDSDDPSAFPLIHCQTFRFRATKAQQNPFWQGDLAEVKVYRIEHRQQVDVFAEPPQLVRPKNASLELANGGFFELGRRLRRYRYQLLDPRDEPYATFCFYLCPQAAWDPSRILQRNATLSSMDSSVSSDSLYLDCEDKEYSIGLPRSGRLPNSSHPPFKPLRSILKSGEQSPTKSRDTRFSLDDLSEARPAKATIRTVSPGSPGSLIVRTKDSIEDLPSSVTRSPTHSSPRRANKSRDLHRSETPEIPPSPNVRRRRESFRQHSRHRSHIRDTLPATNTKEPQQGSRSKPQGSFMSDDWTIEVGRKPPNRQSSELRVEAGLSGGVVSKIRGADGKGREVKSRQKGSNIGEDFKRRLFSPFTSSGTLRRTLAHRNGG